MSQQPDYIILPARVFPGMFDREYQVTIVLNGQPYSLFVPSGHVVDIEGAPGPEGVAGRLRVRVVSEIPGGFLVDLPGEAVGGSRRARISEKEYQVA